MKSRFSAIIALAAAATLQLWGANPSDWNVGAPVGDLRAEIERTPEKSGGIYYAYPVTSDDDLTVPEGFEPVFLTHYGRHGSRWCLKDYQYPMLDSLFALNARTGNLTPLGLDVQQRLLRIGAHAAGHEGELSPLGERQHKAIAGRMAARFPNLFTDSTRIEARSSQIQRCIISMAAFCERLKELNPKLRVQRHATPSDMAFIANGSPEADALGRHDAPWRATEKAMRDSLIEPSRLMASLFVNPEAAIDSMRSGIAKMYAPKPKKGATTPERPEFTQRQAAQLLMKVLHDVSVDLQDVDGLEDVTLLDIFTPDELYNLWQMLNLDMYVRHANAPEGGLHGMMCGRPMLGRFVELADSALAAEGGPQIPVQLHFGHDTNIIRLLALMGVEGCDRSESSAPGYARAWQDFRVSPMGANVQLIFFRNPQGRTLLLVRHNEQNARLPLPYAAEGAPFYDWQTVRAYWKGKL